MLVYNTMRFGTDVFEFPVEQTAPKICARIGGADVQVELVDTQPTPPCIALRTGGQTWYGKLATSGASISPIRTKINNTTYALTN